jgi:hypothetical protein
MDDARYPAKGGVSSLRRQKQRFVEPAHASSFWDIHETREKTDWFTILSLRSVGSAVSRTRPSDFPSFQS